MRNQRPLLFVSAGSLLAFHAQAQPAPAPAYAPAQPTTYYQAPPQAPPPTTASAEPAVEEEERVEGEYPRHLTFGISPLVLANVHWLDKPAHRKVTVGGVRGEDRQYPGFVGGDLAFGVAFDLRYLGTIGVELDVLYQNDRGTGTVQLRDRGNICYLSGRAAASFPTTAHAITIGQRAWHVPLLAKVAIPVGSYGKGHDDDDRDRDHHDDHERRRHSEHCPGFDGDKERHCQPASYARAMSVTLGIGPEFVFPEKAELEIVPEGLASPRSAKAATYVMYTAALGLETRLAKSIDLRLTGALRGSYNPEPKDSVMRRASYALEDGALVTTSYRSEWRYQIAATIGLGWFF